MTIQNHYAVLGVSRLASHADIKTAYNKLVLIAHPDKGGAEADFIIIQAAWEVLRDATARAEFDRKYPAVTGVPGKPYQSQGKSAQDSQIPKTQPFGGKGGGTPWFNTEPDPRAGHSFTTDPHRWTRTGYRDSAGGNAYNSYRGFSRHSPRTGPSKPKPEDASRNQPRPNQNQPPESNDTPMSDAPQAEGTSHEQPRQGKPNPHNTNAGARKRNPSPPFDGSWSPPPASPPLAPVEPVKDLADQANRNADRLKRLADSFRAATSNRPLTELSEGIEIKLRHVHCYLENCEMKLRLRVYAAKQYNADLRAGKVPTPLTAFFPTLARSHLSTNDDDVSHLKSVMQRVLEDTREMLRMKMVLEANGKKQTDHEESVKTLQSSTEALERLLAKLLNNSMGARFPAEY